MRRLSTLILLVSLSKNSFEYLFLTKTAFDQTQEWHSSLEEKVKKEYNFLELNPNYANKTRRILNKSVKDFQAKMDTYLHLINETRSIAILKELKISEDSLVNNVTNITRTYQEIKEKIGKVNSLLLPYDIKSKLEIVNNNSVIPFLKKLNMNKTNDECLQEFQESKQAIYLNIVTYIYMIELQREMLVQYMIRTLILQGDKSKINLLDDLMKSSKNNYRNILQICGNFQKDDSYLWPAKLDKYDKKGLTYDKITNFIQAFVVQPDKLGDNNCDKYTDREIHISSVGCAKGCNGKIYNCKTNENQLEVCPEGTNSERRYEYIRSNSILYGKVHNTCPNNECTLKPTANGLCFCQCDETNKFSDRYFSLREILSDIDVNKVITGVRLVKRNRIFQFEIEQGVLHGYGNVTDQKWKLVDDWKITDKNITEKSDYHRLTYDKRQIDLDIVSLPKNQVVTGIQFKKSISGLKLSVQGTEIEIKTGKLSTTRSVWKENPPASNEFSLIDLDVPIKDREVTQKYLRMRSKCENMFLKFGPSGEKEDVAQTTIPFIDIRNVSTRYGPLQGVGICYKESKGYGGFIAPLLVTFDNRLIADEILKSL